MIRADGSVVPGRVLLLAWLAIAVSVLSGCGSRSTLEDELQATSNPSYDALLERTHAAFTAMCKQAVDCYGRPAVEGHRCWAPTAAGEVSWGPTHSCPGLSACDVRAFEAHREDYTALRECQIEEYYSQADCLSQCPEVADECRVRPSQTECQPTPELFSAFLDCSAAPC